MTGCGVLKITLRCNLIGDQGILVPKRTAVLRSEMLKQVQHDAKGRVSITGYGVS